MVLVSDTTGCVPLQLLLVTPDIALVANVLVHAGVLVVTSVLDRVVLVLAVHEN